LLDHRDEFEKDKMKSTEALGTAKTSMYIQGTTESYTSPECTISRMVVEPELKGIVKRRSEKDIVSEI